MMLLALSTILTNATDKKRPSCSSIEACKTSHLLHFTNEHFLFHVFYPSFISDPTPSAVCHTNTDYQTDPSHIENKQTEQQLSIFGHLTVAFTASHPIFLEMILNPLDV